jgi:hypothetical protein
MSDETMPRDVRGAAVRLRETAAATRLKIAQWSLSKALRRGQRVEAARPFDARWEAVRGAKTLVDRQHPRVLALTRLCGQLREAYRGLTLPYVEEGIRLIPRERLASLEETVERSRGEIGRAAADLQDDFEDVKERSRAVLGRLFNEADYPPNVAEEYQVEYGIVNVEPPDYLRDINPQRYQEEVAAFQRRLEQSVVLAEQALADELAAAVATLARSLEDRDDGRPKAFRSSVLQNVREFFQNFRELKVRDGTELDAVVRQAEDLLGHHARADFKDSRGLRERVREGMAEVVGRLTPLVSPQARRRIEAVDLAAVQLVGD